LWYFAKYLYTPSLETQQGSDNNSTDNDEQTDRFIFEEYLAEDQYCERAKSD